MGVNDKIHDDLIAHDIDLRRVDADCRRRANSRLAELEADIKALLIKIDPYGAVRADARSRRIANFEQEARKLARAAYKDIECENRADLRRIAALESEKVISVIGENLP